MHALCLHSSHLLLYIVARVYLLTITHPCLTASDRLVRKIAPILEIGLDEISILRNRSLKYLNLSKSCISRKEVFQPHLPVRLPCYDLAPVTSFTLKRSCDGHALQVPPTPMA